MMKFWTAALLGLILSTVPAAPALAADAIDPSVIQRPVVDPSSWTLTDIEGKQHQPFVGDAPARACILVFISTDCPIANYYHPTLRQLTEAYRNHDVQLYFVHANPSVTAARAQQHAKDFSITSPVLLDPQHELARLAGATKTPQAAVITPQGVVAYLGRIDNTYAGYGQKRPRPTEHDLRVALNAVLTGEAVPNPRTESVGCFIPFARK
jgi:hypothetical protein